jgi:hypothetical protein
MTVTYTKPEDYDRIPDDDELPEDDTPFYYSQTHRSYLDILPSFLSGDPDEPDFDDGFLY